MARYGLSSRDAQARLHRQLEYLCSRMMKVDWVRELRQPPFTPLVCLGTAFAGLLLIIDFSLAPNGSGSTLFQAVLLLLMSIFNALLFCWEVYLIKTRRVRRLLSRIKPFMESVCPWTSCSYPSRSINTLRGQFTVHAHRDGRVVNLPSSLLVQGDIIELYKDVPLPASAKLIDEEGVSNDTILEMGSYPPVELFQCEDRGQNVRFVEEEKRIRLVVTQTPIIAVFLTTLRKKRATSVLTREKTYGLLANNLLCVIALGVSLLLNVIRYTILRDDVGHWTEMLLQLQVYTILPLLQLIFPLTWAIMNLYGTAKIVLLTEKGPEPSPDRGVRNRLQGMRDILKMMLVLFFHPSMYPNYRVFHILGSLTSLCSVDKEYVLTDSAPIPEKVFFLTRRPLEENLPPRAGENTRVPVIKMADENGIHLKEEGYLDNTHSTRDVQRKLKFKSREQYMLDNTQDVCVEVHVETASVDGVLSVRPTELQAQDDKVVKSSLELERSEMFPTRTELVRSGSDSAMLTSVLHYNTVNTGATTTEPIPADHRPCRSGQTGKPNPKKMPLRFLSQDSTMQSEPSQSSRMGTHNGDSQTNRLSQALSGSAMSFMSPFELVSEILDLSPTPSTQSGLGFDDVNWESFLGSLKPIGVNCLATSHFLRDPYSWSPRGCSEYVRSNLCKTNCVCPLGIEIGVNEFLQGNFTNELIVFGISDPAQTDDNNIVSLIRRPSTSLLTENIIQPHLLSSVLRDKDSGNHLMMSRGSGDIVASCCSDFWDGKDLQPMTNIERGEIEAFFARRHLTSYCVALAYNPLVDMDLSSLPKQKMALYIPKERVQNNSPKDHLRGEHVASFSGEELFSNLLCNQVFLGVVSLQFQPKADIVHLIEDLEMTGIRFVYFTNENEVRGKVFAEKLGLEAGWNCHISLAPGSEDEGVTSTSRDEQEFASCSTSTSSSLNSVINAFQSYIRAKLPKGVHNIRPHLKNVDNVPLLVPLFTDCTVDAIREMIEIMQENGEVVMCLGNAWNHNNLSIYAQADVSLSVIPECANLQCCLDVKDDDATLSTSVSDNNFGNPPQQSNPKAPIWPTPLEMATYLNTAMCQLCVHRHSNVNILEAVTKSRHVVSCIRHGLLLGLSSSLSITILMLLATLLFLPPPLAGGHIFMFLLFSNPVVVLSFLSTPFDPKIKVQMPSRKKKLVNEKLLGAIHFCFTFLPSAFISLFLFALTLYGLCLRGNSESTECNFLLGDRNESSSWNGWRGVNEQGLLLAQDVTALFFTLHLVAHSVRFIHRTAPLWKLFKYISWPYLASISLVTILQIVYFALSQTLAPSTDQLSAPYGLSAVPPYVWFVGIFWCVPLVILHELLKWQDRNLVLKLQRHLKLEFETKLGMNSPF